MCWSIEVSIISWVIGMAGVVYLALRKRTNDIFIAISAAVFVQMQLVDAVMWSQKEKGCTDVIKLASMIGFILIFVEPLANNLALLSTKNAQSSSFKKGVIVSASIYGLLITLLFATSFPKTDDALCPDFKCDHIKWNFFNDIQSKYVLVLWYLFFFVPLCFVDTTIARIVYPLFGLGLVGLVYLFAPEVFGNVWCWAAILSVFLAIFLNPALEKGGNYWDKFKIKRKKETVK